MAIVDTVLENGDAHGFDRDPKNSTETRFFTPNSTIPTYR